MPLFCLIDIRGSHKVSLFVSLSLSHRALRPKAVLPFYGTIFLSFFLSFLHSPRPQLLALKCKENQFSYQRYHSPSKSQAAHSYIFRGQGRGWGHFFAPNPQSHPFHCRRAPAGSAPLCSCADGGGEARPNRGEPVESRVTIEESR